MVNLRNIINLKVIAYIVTELHATACVCGIIMTLTMQQEGHVKCVCTPTFMP